MSRVNLLIRGGYVLTMDAAGDIPGGDVHVQDGVIQAIGINLDVPEAEPVGATGKIVAPGLVSLDKQDLTAQRTALASLGVAEARI